MRVWHSGRPDNCPHRSWRQNRKDQRSRIMTHQDKQRADATDWLGENYNFDDLNKREIEIGLNAWHAASEKARQQRGEAVADFPSGDIENGRACADRLDIERASCRDRVCQSG